MKLVLAEMLSWCGYYSKLGLPYRFNPARVAVATGIKIDKVVNIMVNLVETGIFSVGDDSGFSTIYPTYSAKETVRLLSLLR